MSLDKGSYISSIYYSSFHVLLSYPHMTLILLQWVPISPEYDRGLQDDEVSAIRKYAGNIMETSA